MPTRRVGIEDLAMEHPAGRPEYSEGYYRAFVLDPARHNIEAVWRSSG